MRRVNLDASGSCNRRGKSRIHSRGTEFAEFLILNFTLRALSVSAVNHPTLLCPSYLRGEQEYLV
jgi:hypothetical protein